MSLVNDYIKTLRIWAIILIALGSAFNSNAQFTFCSNPASGLSVTYSITDVTCNGASDGTVTVTVNGGSGNYFIRIVSANNPGVPNFVSATVNTTTFTGLQADASIQITGQASVPGFGTPFCTVFASINEPSAITNTPTVTDPTCNGGSNGSISSSVSGGVPGYTYTWSNGASTPNISGLTAGNYTLTVKDANNCSVVFNYTLTDPPAITATSSITNLTCNGGSNGAIDITVSNGTAPYTYAWSNGASTEDISGLTAGSYSVTITDAAGCSKPVGPFTVTQPTAVTAPA